MEDLSKICLTASTANLGKTPLRKSSIIAGTVASLPDDDREKFKAYLQERYEFPDNISSDANFAHKFLYHLPDTSISVIEDYLKAMHPEKYAELEKVRITDAVPEEKINWRDPRSIDFML